jgi:hypothetical protein
VSGCGAVGAGPGELAVHPAVRGVASRALAMHAKMAGARGRVL